jgi:hypothetical protein
MHGKQVRRDAEGTRLRTDELGFGGRKMRKIASVFIITSVFSTTAMAADIAISTQAGWFGQAAADREAQEIVSNVTAVAVERFPANQQAALATWVKDHTGDGVSDLLILCGQLPATIYTPGNAQADGSLAELFLDDGNCIINTGDYLAYVVDGAGTNGEGGIRALMDIPTITMWDDDTAVTVTPEAAEYTPTLKSLATDRPFHLNELTADWYPELILAQNAAGTRADPVIVTNSVTGGRIGIFYQTSGQDDDPRGEVISEWINNWYLPKFGGATTAARAPSPKDGALIDQKSVQASWRAGDRAKLHDVYFGDDREKVAAATPSDTDVYVGRQAVTQLALGLAGGPAPDGLVPGKTYYWRIDEINEGDPESPWKGNVWSFQIRPLTAFKPFPPDGMRYVDPDQDLSWDIGQGSIFHTVYVGKSFDEVSTAVAGGLMTADPRFDPGTLTLDTTYYWRIDEFAFVTNMTTKGPVWSFTTRGSGGGAKAAYFRGMELAGDPVLTQTEGTIDHDWASGEVAAGLSDSVSARWTANLLVPFTETYRLITSTDDGVRLWFDGRLVIDNWTDHGTTDDTATVNLTAGQVYSIRMEWYENGGGAVARLFWQSSTLGRQIIPQGWLQLPLWATGPSPVHGDPHALQDAVLQWIAGEEATDHDVYFGDDATAVANADTATAGIYKGRQKADKTTFDPGPLEWGKTYYWRVDEINASHADSPWKGSVWSFTAANFLIVEDFESYTDQTGEEIFLTWIDGFTDKSSGSTVGYMAAANGTYGETAIVHGGYQSMPLDYNNVNAPFFSEAQREWMTPQNWTVNGVDTLTLHFRGKSKNGPEKLYVTLVDSAAKIATVVHPNAAIATATQWTQWNIPLQSFAGVNRAKVTMLIIGLGDRSNPKKGGAGQLFIDDIRITKP